MALVVWSNKNHVSLAHTILFPGDVMAGRGSEEVRVCVKTNTIEISEQWNKVKARQTKTNSDLAHLWMKANKVCINLLTGHARMKPNFKIHGELNMT